MRLPFTLVQFLDVMRRYNEAVWPMQLPLLLLGIGAVVLSVRGAPRAGRAVSAILGALWLWMGLAYHLAFFRAINPAALLFAAAFVAQGMLFLWLGAWRDRITFAVRADRAGVAGAALVLYALVAYPLIGHVLGHRWPAAPTFGLPCPTTILTLGLLTWAAPRSPRVLAALLVIPIGWAVVGTSAALQLGMREDFGLTVAAVVAVLHAWRRGAVMRPLRTVLESMGAALEIALQIALGPLLHRWRTRWGASDAEVQRPLPGDDLVPEPEWSYTHAITIDAPRAAVWPWLLQLGQARGGFYSYEALENLVGCDIHNVSELRPDLQMLHEGDVIRMHRSGFGPAVTELDAVRALVLGGDPDANGSRATWSFHLVELPGGRTRLLERGRNAPGRGMVAKLGFGPYLLDPIGFVMSRKMLRTIKRLAEAHAAARRAPSASPARTGDTP
ncbi:MAG: DUF6064 family protein [Gemmatirosa sp.]